MLTDDDLANLVTAKEACQILGGSKPINLSTLYRGIAAGRWPAPIKLGPCTSRWVRSELQAAVRRLADQRELTDAAGV